MSILPNHSPIGPFVLAMMTGLPPMMPRITKLVLVNSSNSTQIRSPRLLMAGEEWPTVSLVSLPRVEEKSCPTWFSSTWDQSTSPSALMEGHPLMLKPEAISSGQGPAPQLLAYLLRETA